MGLDVPRRGADPGDDPPRRFVHTGDDDDPAVAQVVDLVEKAAGTVVYLRVLPGNIEDYRAHG